MITITLLSNAGLLVELNGAVVMVDGLYDAQGLPFSDVPEAVLAAARPDYLAFTHTHRDHLDEEKLTAYLAGRSVRGLLLPPKVRAQLHGALAMVMSGLGGTITLPEFTLRWARTPHLGDARPAHHSFVITCGDQCVLVAGDARPSRQLESLCAGRALAAAVVTPLYLQTEEGRAQLLDRLRPGAAYLYHLPRPEDDQWGLHRMAARQRERLGDRLPTRLLDQPGVPVAL